MLTITEYTIGLYNYIYITIDATIQTLWWRLATLSATRFKTEIDLFGSTTSTRSDVQYSAPPRLRVVVSTCVPDHTVRFKLSMSRWTHQRIHVHVRYVAQVCEPSSFDCHHAEAHRPVGISEHIHSLQKHQVKTFIYTNSCTVSAKKGENEFKPWNT
jgi:hypothetical protein